MKHDVCKHNNEYLLSYETDEVEYKGALSQDQPLSSVCRYDRISLFNR